MGVLLTMACALALLTPAAGDYLPSRDLVLPFAIVTGREPESFDLIDFREAKRAELRPKPVDADPHSIFVIKQHLGIAAGYDNGIARGAVGWYLTVAEWKRWNLGVPSPEIGFARYPVYDAKLGRALMQEQMTFLVSVASAHYRLGYVRSWGLHAYLNLEQIYDARSNQGGSQFGISFSSK